MKTITQEGLTSIGINVRSYYDYQHERIAMDGRLGQTKTGTLKKKAADRDPALLVYLQDRRDEIFAMEKGLEKEIAEMISKHPLWIHFLSNVKGCGPVMAAVIVTEFDIHKASMVSNLVSFMGAAPGKDRRVKGEKCRFNQFLKSKLCGVLGSGFLQAKSVPYSGYYYNRKMRTENSDMLVNERIRMEDRKGEYKGKKIWVVKWRDAYPLHRHQDAIRIMMKEFLKDLYVAWRELEGLEVRKPFSEEYLGRYHHKEAA